MPTQKIFFEMLDKAQKEHEYVRQICSIIDFTTEQEIEDYSKRDFSHPVDLVLIGNLCI